MKTARSLHASDGRTTGKETPPPWTATPTPLTPLTRTAAWLPSGTLVVAVTPTASPCARQTSSAATGSTLVTLGAASCTRRAAADAASGRRGAQRVEASYSSPSLAK